MITNYQHLHLNSKRQEEGRKEGKKEKKLWCVRVQPLFLLYCVGAVPHALPLAQHPDSIQVGSFAFASGSAPPLYISYCPPLLAFPSQRELWMLKPCSWSRQRRCCCTAAATAAKPTLIRSKRRPQNRQKGAPHRC